MICAYIHKQVEELVFGRIGILDFGTRLHRPCAFTGAASPPAEAWSKFKAPILSNSQFFNLFVYTLVILFFLQVPFAYASKFCLFTPPQDWKIAKPENSSPHIKICFIKEKESGFCPSLNLATEDIDISIEDYIKIIKKIHESNPNNLWRDLGKVNTAAGLARLTAIDTKTQWGETRLLQLIFLKEGTIYILTGGALKEEFANYYSQFFAAFRSLQFTDDLFDVISNAEEKATLRKSFENLILSWQKKSLVLESNQTTPIDLENEELLIFQKQITKCSDKLGNYWQMLMMQQVAEKLLN